MEKKSEQLRGDNASQKVLANNIQQSNPVFIHTHIVKGMQHLQLDQDDDAQEKKTKKSTERKRKKTQKTK